MGKFASKVVEQAKAWIGKNEKDGSHKEIIDIYNSQKELPQGLPRGHKLSYSEPWCAATVSAIAVALGYTDIIPTECSCNKLIELAKKMGIWIEDESVAPEAAWFVVYDWDDSGKGDNTGRADHVGVVETVINGEITVIEGNYKDAVGRRPLEVNGKYIRGYIAPKYDTEDKPATTKQGVCNVEIKVLKKGTKGKEVKAMQILLIGYGFSCGNKGADGSFGGATDKTLRAYQKAKGLSVDGSCGPKTWASLLGTG